MSLNFIYSRIKKTNSLFLNGVKSKADDLGVESSRSFEPKQTIFWAKADDPKKIFFLSQSRRSYFFYFLYIKADDLSENLTVALFFYSMLELFSGTLVPRLA